MAPPLIQAKDLLKNYEQQLNNELASTASPSWSTIAIRLDKMRSHCASILLRDIELAKTNGIDDERLWASHRSVNDRYRVQYTLTPKFKPVERRKLDTEYLRYIKAAQRFYRGYIYNLSIAYGGIGELQEVAEKVERGHSGDHVEMKCATEAVREHVLRSCCTSLSQLGDLSRYRETRLPSKDKGPDWAHAIGYYELAQVVMPRYGLAQNQLAVVAIADNNNFRSVYHLYMSLLAAEPHPHAFNNLKKAMYKIIGLRESGGLFKGNASSCAGSTVLRAWYLQVISTCFQGKGHFQQDQSEREYLQHLTSFIAGGPDDTTLYKITLINIAAGHHARLLFASNSESADRMNSFLQFLHLNVKTLSVILEAFELELKQIRNSRLTPMMPKLLPTLRLYSAWLIQTGRIIAGATQLNLESVQWPLWTMYARCLTLMVSIFPSATQLPEVSHLLDEDADTIGFVPLHGDGTEDIWLDENHQLKHRRDGARNSLKVTDLDEQEQLTRVRYILRTGLHLALQSDLVPIQFSSHNACFYFKSTGPCATSLHTGTHIIKHPSGAMVPRGPGSDSSMPASIAIDRDTQAAQMVDELVSDDLVVSSPAACIARNVESPAASPLMSRVDVRTSSTLTCPEPAALPQGTVCSAQLGPKLADLHSQTARTKPATLPQSRLNPQQTHSLRLSRLSEDQSHIHLSCHARNHPNESIISKSSIWAPDTEGSFGVPLGNGTFGVAQEHIIVNGFSGSPVILASSEPTWSVVRPTRQDSNM